MVLSISVQKSNSRLKKYLSILAAEKINE